MVSKKIVPNYKRTKKANYKSATKLQTWYQRKIQYQITKVPESNNIKCEKCYTFKSDISKTTKYPI